MPGASTYSCETHGESSKHESTLEAPPMSPISELGSAEMEENRSTTPGMHAYGKVVDNIKESKLFSYIAGNGGQSQRRDADKEEESIVSEASGKLHALMLV